MFLLDTCVLSEATKPQKNAGVSQWLTAQNLDEQYVSAVTIGELHYGAKRLPEGARRRRLSVWIEEIEHDYAGRIVPLDQAVAARWGELRAEHPNMKLADSQIAATAMTYGFRLVTRNVKDFAPAGLVVVDPWRGAV